MIKLLPILDIAAWMYVWIGIITIIKVINVISGFAAQKKYVTVHSAINKITGVLLFVLPLTVKFVDLRYSATIVCATATVAAVREGYYVRTGRNEKQSDKYDDHALAL